MILVIALGAALAVALATHLGGSTAETPTATPTIDPRLILHPRHVPITGILAGSTLSGDLYPGLPGSNSLELRASPATTASHVDLIATMPGMQMVPARSKLTLQGGAYHGTMTLPMFGQYVAHLTASSGGITGTARLVVPLALGQ